MWQADSAELETLCRIFKATLSSLASERAAANEQLAQARLLPEYENYLCEILVHHTTTTLDVRAAAGLGLKNAITKAPGAARDAIKAVVFDGLTLGETIVRNITGNVVTALFSAQGYRGWPELVPRLVTLSQDNTPAAEAAVAALAKICEDSGASLDADYDGVRPLDAITSTLVPLAAQVSPKQRATIVRCLNVVAGLGTAALTRFIDTYLPALFSLAHDTSTAVRKNVCLAFLVIMETAPAKLGPHIDGVVQFCIHVMEDLDEEVAMEACEFLLALAEGENRSVHVAAVIPTLLKRMVYTDDQIVLMEILDLRDSAAVADREQDIRPSNVKLKELHLARAVESDSDDDDDDELEQWNIRRCAAATLDALSVAKPLETTQATLPLLQSQIVSAEWPEREAAILALGAISKSCIEVAADELNAVVPYLVERLKDAEPRVRLIACWAVSRYAAWVCQAGFGPTFEAVVRLMLDTQKIVQEAACLAVMSFVEAADPPQLQDYVAPLLEHLAQCIALYQRKNLMVLYDCVLTFVEKIGPDVFCESPLHAATLLPPLLRNWELLGDDDQALWPLLECMAAVAATMGEAFAPYAVPVYERAVKILGNAVLSNQQGHTDPLIESPEKDFIVTSLDLIDGLVQGFKAHSMELLSQNGTDLMALVIICLEDHDDDVRQLAYALLGDLAIFTSTALQPHVQTLAVCVGNEINNYSYTTFAVTNNAVWSFGEMCLTVSGVEPYHPNIVGLLVPLLLSADTQQTVLENAAICLGRIGKTSPGVVGPRIPEILHAWCTQIMYVPENEEKESAFFGMINTLQTCGDWTGGRGQQDLAMFITCVGNYFEPSEKLKETFFQVLAGYKSALGASWNELMRLVDPDTRGFLHSTYGIA